MSDWTFSATFLAVGTGMAVFATYVVCRARTEQTHNRMLALEREMAVARMREEANEKKLAKIFEAVVELRETAQDQLGQLGEKLDRLIAESFTEGNRSAA